MDDREAIRRAAARGQVAPTSAIPNPKLPKPPRSPAGRCHWQCRACDELFAAWAAAERHSDANPGHRRLELVYMP